jgi:class III poly(R)-hydroxyalkanoic acid synthase PhaE subunit
LIKSWSTITSNLSNADDISIFFKEEKNNPQEFSKIIQKGWKDLIRIQQEWLKNAPNVNELTGVGRTENINQNILNTWTELYENEFRKYFTIPQLGLAREYQEKTVRAFDKLNIFQTKTSEFMNFLLGPMKKSFDAIQEELIATAKEGNTPKNGKNYYKEWVKKLENYYNELYKTAEYTQAMGETLTAMEEFITVRNDLLQDMMKSLPIPSQNEMDELYKDIYQLKKRLQKLEKKQKANK